jgi:hypothetical protein
VDRDAQIVIGYLKNNKCLNVNEGWRLPVRDFQGAIIRAKNEYGYDIRERRNKWNHTEFYLVKK